MFVASFHRAEPASRPPRPKIGETAQLLRSAAPPSRRLRHRLLRQPRQDRAHRANVCGDAALPAVAFHAGLDPAAQARSALARFRSGEPVVVVATIAFGMGIDRPDVRFVVHLDMPDSPEAFYQQIGRAGRDGDAAETLLLYGGEDIARARHWLAQSAAPEAQKRVMRDRLEAMIALTETADCRTRALLACFGEDLPEPCGHCDNCVAPPRLFDAHRGGAEGAVSGLSHRPGVRRHAHRLGAARRGDRGGAAPRPRPAADLRCRRATIRRRTGAA